MNKTAVALLVLGFVVRAHAQPEPAQPYRLEREGDYELPAVEVAWWDVGAKQMRRARLAAVAFSVAPAPARADEIPLPVETEATGPAQPAQGPARWSHLVVWTGLGAVALAFVGWAFRPLARRVFQARARVAEARRRSEDSEPAWFGRVRRAAARGDAAATYRALIGWAQRLGPTGTLGAFLAQMDDSELAEEAGRLGGMLYGREPAAAWTGTRLVPRLARPGRDAVLEGLARAKGVAASVPGEKARSHAQRLQLLEGEAKAKGRGLWARRG